MLETGAYKNKVESNYGESYYSANRQKEVSSTSSSI